jgi:hypothetical protein
MGRGIFLIGSQTSLANHKREGRQMMCANGLPGLRYEIACGQLAFDF